MNDKEKNRRDFPYAAEIIDQLREHFGNGVKLNAARNAQGVTIGKVPQHWAANDEPRDAA